MNSIKLLQENLTYISTDVEESISKFDFNKEYGYKRIPVLFTKAFRHLIGNKYLSVEHITSNAPQPEKLRKMSKSALDLSLPLAEYISLDVSGYYYQVNLYDLPREIYYQLNLDQFNSWLPENEMLLDNSPLERVTLCNSGAFEDLQINSQSSGQWNYLVEGHKTWLIYPQAYSDYIGKRKDYFSLETKWDDLSEILTMDFKPLLCNQQPGELLFIPGGYYYSAISLQLSLSISKLYVNETNYDQVRTCFSSENNLEKTNKIEALIKAGFEHQVIS